MLITNPGCGPFMSVGGMVGDKDCEWVAREFLLLFVSFSVKVNLILFVGEIKWVLLSLKVC